MFQHVHGLDLLFHKTSTKTTLYAVNKALDSIENSIRFIAGFLTPLVMEFVFISALIGGYFGPLYLLNMWGMLGAYTLFTKQYSKKRQTYVREKFQTGKKSEFFLNESIVNFETVKYFGNENLEMNRYEKINGEIRKAALKVQYSLGYINMGQQMIFCLGIVGNLLMAARDVSTGVMTAGDIVMMQALFMQIAQPLFIMGTVFR